MTHYTTHYHDFRLASYQSYHTIIADSCLVGLYHTMLAGWYLVDVITPTQQAGVL